MPARPRAFSVHVTRREAEILTLLAQGFSNAEIAVAMKITNGTVKHHICHALIKLDLHSRVLLAQYWSFPIFRLGAGMGAGREDG
jgi:DNA-binding NarL/FixJ family response regulator